MALPVLAIFGPTAVGKTAIAIAVAERLRALGHDPVAIGVDALQVYDGLPLITAQPTADEQAALEHRLVGFLPLSAAWSVAQHTEVAHREIDAAREAGRVAIVVGGTGLYLRSALANLALAPPPPPGLRAELTARASDPGGLAALFAELRERDPAAAALVRPTDTTRVLRAHELLALGRSLTDASANDDLWSDEMRVPTVLVGLTMDRSALRDRAAMRMGAMVEAGAIEEARAAQEAGIGETAAAAVGYRELLAGDAEGAITRTRQLAKRQETWMRRLGGASILDIGGRLPDDVAEEIVGRWQATPPS